MPYPPLGQPYGGPFIELQTIDSTNNYALSQIHAGLAQHGYAVFAHEQTSGKGQRGRQWLSQPGENIALSIVLKPSPLPIPAQFRLSVCIASAVHEFFAKYAGFDTAIKWPNDLYWKDRKAGGILIENIIRGGLVNGAGWDWAVAGIGININQSQFSPGLGNAVSLRQITGKNFDTITLAHELATNVIRYYDILVNDGYDTILDYYLSHFYMKNQLVKFRSQNRVFEAVVKGITAQGQLIVKHSIEEEFAVGDIEWLIK